MWCRDGFVHLLACRFRGAQRGRRPRPRDQRRLARRRPRQAGLPRCQQTDPGFWATHSVVLWDRYTAITRAAGPPPRRRGSGRDPGRAASGCPPAMPPEPGWHRPAPLYFRGDGHEGDPGLASFPRQDANGIRHARKRWRPADPGTCTCQFCLCNEIDRTATAAHPSHPAGSTGCRWLMLAAEMAGLVERRTGGHRRIPP